MGQLILVFVEQKFLHFPILAISVMEKSCSVLRLVPFLRTVGGGGGGGEREGGGVGGLGSRVD